MLIHYKRRYISQYGKLIFFTKKSVKWHRLWILSFKLPIPTVSLHLGPYLKGECMNKKAKPLKRSLLVEDQNDIRVLGLCRLVWEEFDYNE